MADEIVQIYDLDPKQSSELTGGEYVPISQNKKTYRIFTSALLNDVYAGLDSTSSTKQLAANQGKALKDLSDWQNSADGLIFDFDTAIETVASELDLTVTIADGRIMGINDTTPVEFTGVTITVVENAGIVLTLSGGLYLWSVVDDLSTITEGDSTTKWVVAKNINGTLYSRIPSFVNIPDDLINGSDASVLHNHASLYAPIVSSTSIASSATPTPTGDSRENELYITALAVAAVIAAPSETAANGNTLMIRIEDDGTARALSFNAIYEVVGATLPTTTTAGKKIYIGCIYNSTDTKWDVVSVIEEV